MATLTGGRRVWNHFEDEDKQDVRKISPETLSVSCAVIGSLVHGRWFITVCVCVKKGGGGGARSQTRKALAEPSKYSDVSKMFLTMID